MPLQETTKRCGRHTSVKSPLTTRIHPSIHPFNRPVIVVFVANVTESGWRQGAEVVEEEKEDRASEIKGVRTVKSQNQKYIKEINSSGKAFKTPNNSPPTLTTTIAARVVLVVVSDSAAAGFMGSTLYCTEQM